MQEEKKKGRHMWAIAVKLRAKEKGRTAWEPHGLSRGESKRPLPKQKPRPPKGWVRELVDS